MRFSVIIPAYNAEAFIGRCLESVIGQDYPKDRYEVIVVDDCSPDRQNDIVRQIASKTVVPVRLISHSNNLRQGGARNTGLRAAQGEYVLFLDADDYWTCSNALKTIDDLLSTEEKPIDLLHFSQYQSSAPIGLCDSDCAPTGRKEWSPMQFLIRDDFSCCVWLACYKREMIANNNVWFREQCYFEDADWCRRIALCANRIISVSYPFYFYTYQPESASNKAQLATLMDSVKSCVITFEWALCNQSINAEIRQKLNEQILFGGIGTVVRASRNYPVSDTLLALQLMQNSPILSPAHYPSKLRNRLFLFFLHHAPSLLAIPLRWATRAKRVLKSIM